MRPCFEVVCVGGGANGMGGTWGKMHIFIGQH